MRRLKTSVFKNHPAEEKWWFWLTASFLADRLPLMPKLIAGLGQPIEKRALTAPYVPLDTSP